MNDEKRPRSHAVMVLGGSGFIGRHVVEALGRTEARIVIGSRRPERLGRRLPDAARQCERRATRFEQLLEADDWCDLLYGIGVVVNCVGILRQRGRETYDRVHRLAPAALAAACRLRGIRLIHVSALGLDASSRSRFLTSKRAGEQALRDSGADWFIVRPSLLDGEGGFGARWLRRVASWPVQPVPAGTSGKIAALDVRDLGEALARLTSMPRSPGRAVAGREIELGGGEARTLREHLLALRRMQTRRKAWQIPVPATFARVLSHVCDFLHLTPFSYGHWELLSRDNCPTQNHIDRILGRPPRPVGRTPVIIGSTAETGRAPGFIQTPRFSRR